MAEFDVRLDVKITCGAVVENAVLILHDIEAVDEQDAVNIVADDAGTRLPSGYVEINPPE